MSFNAHEISTENGRPVRLYQFTLETGGDSDVTWRYSNSTRHITAGGFAWFARPISDSGLSISGENSSDAMKISAPFALGPVQQFLGTPPNRSMRVIVYNKHEGDDELIACYAGEVSSIGWPAPGIAEISCETDEATMQRQGLREGWNRICSYAPYDENTCKVLKSSHEVASVVTAIGEGFIEADAAIDAEDEAHFTGGFIEFNDPIRGIEYLTVETHTAPTVSPLAPARLRIFGPMDRLAVGMQFKAYPGCDHTNEMCDTRFGNILNNGGYKWMPGKSPFDGTPVF